MGLKIPLPPSRGRERRAPRQKPAHGCAIDGRGGGEDSLFCFVRRIRPVVPVEDGVNVGCFLLVVSIAASNTAGLL